MQQTENLPPNKLLEEKNFNSLEDSLQETAKNEQTSLKQKQQNAAKALKNVDVYNGLSTQTTFKGNVQANSKPLQAVADTDRRQNANSSTTEAALKDAVNSHLQIVWGNKYKTNMVLVKKALTWLDLPPLNLNEISAGSDNGKTNNQVFSGFLNLSFKNIVSFLSKMLELGNMLAEDQGIIGETPTLTLNKSEAKEQRKKLTSDPAFNAALTNKVHPLHKSAVAQIQHLNRIIVK